MEPGQAQSDDASQQVRGKGRSRGLHAGIKQTSPASAVASQLETLGVTPGATARGGRSPGSGSESRYAGSNDGDSGDGRESSSSGNDGDGNERGRSRISPPGERSTPRIRRNRNDIVVTRSEGFDKKGTSGSQIQLVANYFEASRRGGKEWKLFKYHVEYEPDIPIDRKGFRRGLLNKPEIKELLGANMFDGMSLYVSKQLREEAMQFSVADREGNAYVVKSKLVEELRRTDPMYITFYNLTIKKIQEIIGLTEMGRDFFDHTKAIKIDAYRLELLPGFRTAMREHDLNLLMCVDVTHKVLRQDSVLDIMKEIRQSAGPNYKKACENEIVGTVVMTSYNRKTYSVDGILWEETPSTEFEVRGQKIDMKTYYKTKYNIDIRSLGQPLLITKLKKKDMHRGMTQPAKLVPELCQMTGLNDSLRANFQLMKSLSNHLFMPPPDRTATVTNFMRSVNSNVNARNELFTWGIKFKDDLVKLPGRVLPREQILFDQNQIETPDDKADWTIAFRTKRMALSIPLQRWVVMVPERESRSLDNLLGMMQSNARKMGFDIARPLNIITLPRVDSHTYNERLGQLLSTQGRNLQMVFVVLPNNKKEAYGVVKDLTYVQFGIPSQCFVAKNMQNKGLMSIATKVVVQMNAKLGGIPWNLKVPLQNLMVCGFDVHKGTMCRGKTVGALVTSLNKECTRFFSAVAFHDSMEELSENIVLKMKSAFMAYHQANGQLPNRVFFYRDGVGEGELRFVYEHELEQIRKTMAEIYRQANTDPPRLNYIVCTKRINTKLFRQTPRGFDNPPPGTVVDDVITLPERYDFFLVAQSSRQGTVSPTSYNVLLDQSQLNADKVQMLTFKLCHGYFNWSGTVSVPSPVQYAHKLAFLTGTALGVSAHTNLSNLLYFL